MREIALVAAGLIIGGSFENNNNVPVSDKPGQALY